MILITGAAGYIGTKVVEFLSKQGVPIRAIDNFRVQPVSEINGVPIEKMDLTAEEDVKKMVRDVDTIIHLGAVSDIAQCEIQARDAVLINLLSLKYLIREAVNAGVAKIIFPSSFAVYDPRSTTITEQSPVNPRNFYGQLKKWAEEMLLAEQARGNLETVIFRQSNVYGKSWVSKQTVVESFCRALLANQKILVRGTGRQTRNFIHVDDVVWAYYQALSPSIRGVYNLGGEETRSIWDLALLVNQVGQECLGRSVPIVRQQEDGFREERTYFTALDNRKIKTLFKGKKMKSLKEGIREYFLEPA
ncbi:UDP-glucose 4-epimerase [Planifilum fimeticola]|uniref:UDP-glucose 4-epimerase n=1 Tax=Planifilum fimeticola TaxID=201975 RepID=A0A2T0LHD5_9BACL|nr:NAD(P)-dependent oxidoreductase [Planifilum fimeticola]PRX41777.1 UDP-glucose 4-epimerase [Planifilum fimeticola]